MQKLVTAFPAFVNATGRTLLGRAATALHVASKATPAIFDLLLPRAKPSGDNRAYGGWSPLMLSVHWKRDAMRDELLRRGANVG